MKPTSAIVAVLALLLVAPPRALAAPVWKPVVQSGGGDREGELLVHTGSQLLLGLGCKHGICQYGEHGTTFGDLLGLSGTSWSTVSSDGPTPRFGVAYAPTGDGRALVFGGNVVDDSLAQVGNWDDTWLASASGWTQVDASTHPPALRFAGMAYDSANGRDLLFGGRDASNGDCSAVWAFTVATQRWDQLWIGQCVSETSTCGDSTTEPCGRMAPAVTYDSDDGSLLVYGGDTGGWSMRDLWKFSCTPGDPTDCAWTLVGRDQSSMPPPLEGATLTWDPARHVAVLFGGNSFGLPEFDGLYADTWEWRPSGWTKVNLSTHPSARYYQAATYDPQKQRVLVYGGLSGTSDDASNELWSYADPSSTGGSTGGSDGGTGGGSTGGSDGGSTGGSSGGGSGGGSTGGSGGTRPGSGGGRYGCETVPVASLLAAAVALAFVRRRRAR